MTVSVIIPEYSEVILKMRITLWSLEIFLPHCNLM